MKPITRRKLLTIAAAGILAPSLKPLASQACPRGFPESGELVDLDAITGDLTDPAEFPPDVLARFLAGWELAAQQKNLPDRWRRLRYDGAVQWRDDGDSSLIAWYGIGPEEWSRSRSADLAAWLGNRSAKNPVLATEVIAAGRAWCIVSRGRLSPALRQELHKPAWERDRSVVG